MTPFLQEIYNASTALQNGASILYPTDTIWGLGCDACNPEAVKKIYTIKQRAEEKSCIILVSSILSLMQYIAIPPLDLEEIMAPFEDKPTTFILDHAIQLADNLIHEDGSIAFRIPKDDFCIQLLKKFGKPIVSTSANISGNPAPASFSDIDAAIKTKVSYIVKHRQEETQKATPSRIIKINEDSSLTIIRP